MAKSPAVLLSAALAVLGIDCLAEWDDARTLPRNLTPQGCFMFVTHKRLLLSISLIAALLLAAKGTPADEPAPTKAEAKSPARIFLDQAKTLRLAKLLENLYVLDELNVTDEAFTQLENVKGDEHLILRRQSDAMSREVKAAQVLPAAERAERMRNFMQSLQAARDAAAETLAIQRFNI
ncbi:MAG: hypothetical protein K8R36_18605, partial [Planctomycetales bacterium]|nr:hypothetical protein [Planctomycetales bacterium]